jgi:hypothetical protein
MNEFIEVPKKVYEIFLEWASDNIEGFRYEVITVSDRTVIRDGDGDMIAYRNLAYEETFHIKKEILDLWGK